MPAYPKSLEELINELVKLPGIGRRSAERICHYLISDLDSKIERLSSALLRVKERIKLCQICNNLSEDQICQICQDEKRERDIICIVEEPKDVLAIEKTKVFGGYYYVLLGSISPLEGKGLKDLNIEKLIERIKKDNIKEVIIATDTDSEGEITALYLKETIKPLGVKLSRLCVGIPLGSNLEYIDSQTLSKALEYRGEL